MNFSVRKNKDNCIKIHKELSLFTVMNPRDSVWRRKSASFVPAKHSLASSAGFY